MTSKNDNKKQQTNENISIKIDINDKMELADRFKDLKENTNYKKQINGIIKKKIKESNRTLQL